MVTKSTGNYPYTETQTHPYKHILTHTKIDSWLRLHMRDKIINVNTRVHVPFLEIKFD